MMWGTNRSSANHLVCRQVIGFSYHSYDHKISGYTWHVHMKNSSYNCHFQRTVQKFLIIKWQSLIQGIYGGYSWLAEEQSNWVICNQQIYPITLTQIHFIVPVLFLFNNYNMHTPTRNTDIRAIFWWHLPQHPQQKPSKCLEIWIFQAT